METEQQALLDKLAKMLDFIKDCATNYDCDVDAHKYNTPCRACNAMKLLKEASSLSKE